MGDGARCPEHVGPRHDRKRSGAEIQRPAEDTGHGAQPGHLTRSAQCPRARTVCGPTGLRTGLPGTRTDYVCPRICPEERRAPRSRTTPQTRTFGLPTAGLASGNAEIPLSDGAALIITVSADVDRTGRRHVNVPIAPDVTVPFAEEDARGPEVDPVLKSALAWLKKQPLCRS